MVTEDSRFAGSFVLGQSLLRHACLQVDWYGTVLLDENSSIVIREYSIQAKAILDTGAGSNVMIEGLWRKLGAPSLQPYDAQLYTAGTSRCLTEFYPSPSLPLDDPTWEHLLRTRDVPPTHLQDHLLQYRTVEETNQLRGIIYHNLLAFASDKYDFGCTHLIEHRIDLVEGAKSHKETLRRINPEKQRQADEQVQALLELGVIEPAQSTWASGIVMAKKKEPGVLRMCIDFRILNEQTVGDAYPLPTIHDTVTSLRSARVFTSIDISNAFWQIITRKVDR